MADELKLQRVTLTKNLNTLREREAKYGGNAPLELLNLIDDHLTAMALFVQYLDGQLSREQLGTELLPLNLAINRDIIGSARAMGLGSPYKALIDYEIPDVPLFYDRRVAIKELFACLQPGTLNHLPRRVGRGQKLTFAGRPGLAPAGPWTFVALPAPLESRPGQRPGRAIGFFLA